MSQLPSTVGHLRHDFTSFAFPAPPPPQHLTPAQERAISDAFRQHSSDGSALTRHEFKCAYAQLTGSKPTQQVQSQLMCKPRPEHGSFESTVTWERFSGAMQELMRAADPSEHVRQVFKAFDVRCAGYISREDAHAVFSKAAPSVNHRVVDEVFDELDMDRDGRVSCSDFVHMMHTRVA